MDFVQAVWQSVLTRDGQDLGRFTNARHFRGFLEGVARNKVFEEHRRRTRTRKYSLQREEPLYVRRGDREMPREVVGSDPTPSQDAQARDRFDQLVEGRSPQETEVVELRRRGLTYEEIAAQTGLSERSVRRIIRGDPPADGGPEMAMMSHPPRRDRTPERRGNRARFPLD